MSIHFGRVRSLATVSVLLTLLSGPAYAQVAASDSVRVVVVRELSPTLAGVLEAVVPTTGYLYAGNWKRGIPLGIVRVIGQILVMTDDTPSSSVLYEDGCGTACTVGGFLYLGATIFAIVDVVQMTKRENARRIDEAGMASLVPRIDQTGAGFSLSFRPRW